MYKKTFKEFMNEGRTINRWTVLRIGMIGALSGALLATIFLLMAHVL